MNFKINTKFQSSVTLSSGEGRGEVLMTSSVVEYRGEVFKAEFIERCLDVRDQFARF